jgi:hypothetical protein
MRTALALALLLAPLGPALAEDTDLPPFDIAGAWTCVQQCQTGPSPGHATAVIQNGRRFLFVDERGEKEQAEWMGGYQISFIGCDNNAILSPDLKRIDFIFGSVWVR